MMELFPDIGPQFDVRNTYTDTEYAVGSLTAVGPSNCRPVLLIRICELRQ